MELSAARHVYSNMPAGENHRGTWPRAHLAGQLRPRVCACLLVLAGLVLLPCGLMAQEIAVPDAPGEEHSASLHGTVTDEDGSLLPGARVEVSCGGASFVETADGLGEFRVDGLSACIYDVRVLDEGFVKVDESVPLLEGESRELMPIEMRISGVRSDVTVLATQHEIAAAQVSAEEKQRVFGVIPNFYVVYDRVPAPLATGQKFHLAWRSTVDPISLLGAGVSAGIEQSSNSFPGYGQGVSGYAKRYGAAFADGAVGTFLTGAVLPMVFHQDPRYYYQGTGSIKSRALHAVASVVVTHGDNGRTEVNYSNLIGSFASAGISNVYYPATDRHGVGLTLQNAAIGMAFGAFSSVMQEFVVRRLTPHLPHAQP